MNMKRMSVEQLFHPLSPEYEYEKHEQWEESGDIVDCPQHDDELSSERRHEANEFEDAQKAECPQHAQTSLSVLS